MRSSVQIAAINAPVDRAAAKHWLNIKRLASAVTVEHIVRRTIEMEARM
jgi:hypothetical protein